MMGMDFTRKNFPAYLVGVKPGTDLRTLPGYPHDDATIDDTAPRDEPDEPGDPSYPHHTVAPPDGRFIVPAARDVR